LDKTCITFPLGKENFIAEFHNAVDQNTCTNLIYKLISEKIDVFTLGETGGGITPHIKKSFDVKLSDPSVFSKIKIKEYDFFKNAESYISDRIASCVHEYIHAYSSLNDLPNIEITGLQIQRYFKNNGYYKSHLDSVPWMTGIDGPGSVRVLAVILYLNTVEDGGETFFEYQNANIKAEQGKVVIFPTDWKYLHGGKVPYSCDKWISSSFVLTSMQERL